MARTSEELFEIVDLDDRACLYYYKLPRKPSAQVS